MKSCENCGVPQEKRPGVCLEFMAKYTDGPYNCWKPIVCKTCQGTGKICDKCGVCWDKCKNNAHIGIPELIPCPACQPKEPEKTCGNCGWQDKTKKPIDCELQKYQTYCGLMKSYEDIRSIARKWDNCQWKPICETCGGTGEVEKKHCGACSICHYSKKPWPVNTCAHSYYKNIPCPTCQTVEVCGKCKGTGKVCSAFCEYVDTDKTICDSTNGCKHQIPCPACQKPKEERLMVPVRWEKSKANEENSVLITNAGVIGSVTVTMDGLAFRATAVDKIIQDTSLSNHGGTKRFDDEQQAQQAVEKALGIERK